MLQRLTWFVPSPLPGYAVAPASIKFSRSTMTWRLTLPGDDERTFAHSWHALAYAADHGYDPYEGSVALGFIGLRMRVCEYD